MAADGAIPKMGFGTYGRWGGDGIASLRAALEAGYRHLDTAQSYRTEAECGEAIRESGIPREDIFVTTKIDAPNCHRGKLIPSLQHSIEEFGGGYFDLTLIHWPTAHGGELPMAEYLPELVEAQARGLTRLIGVSNFTIAHLDRAEAMIGTGRIATNQVERHPYLQNRKLRDNCVARGIAVTCYQPIAKGTTAGNAVMEAIARAHGATAHQVSLAFLLQQGDIVIPTSGKPDHIRQNFAAQNLRLSDAEMRQIEGLERNGRRIDPSHAPDWD